MTRKDFNLIANALLVSRPFANEKEKLDQWVLLRDQLTASLRGTNPAFDAQRFFEACGKPRV